MRKAVILLIALTLATMTFAWAGCGGGSSSDSPEQVVEKFLSASMEENADAAYELLTQADKDELTDKEGLVEGFSQGVEGYEVGVATISGDEARVPVNFKLTGLDQDFGFDM